MGEPEGWKTHEPRDSVPRLNSLKIRYSTLVSPQASGLEETILRGICIVIVEKAIYIQLVPNLRSQH